MTSLADIVQTYMNPRISDPIVKVSVKTIRYLIVLGKTMNFKVSTKENLKTPAR